MIANKEVYAFTDQRILRTDYYMSCGNTKGDCYVLCPVCKKEVGLREAYFDRYNTKLGKQVHQSCLSEKRKKEIAKEQTAAVIGNIVNDYA